jgi:hypothetical protein
MGHAGASYRKSRCVRGVDATSSNFLLKDGVYERKEAIETFCCAEG